MGDKYNIIEGIQKFPTFHYKELNDIISKKDVFSKEDTINSLFSLKNLLEQVENEITNLVRTNMNNFNIQSSKYNKKPYYYKILSQLDVLLCNVILSKLDPKNEIVKFDRNEYIKELKEIHGFNVDFDLKVNKLSIIFDVLEKIINSEHKCAISFLNVYYNFLICFVKEIIEKIKSFKELKIENYNSYGFENENTLFDLILYLEHLYTICLFLGYGYLIEKKLNQKIGKIYQKFHMKLFVKEKRIFKINSKKVL